MENIMMLPSFLICTILQMLDFNSMLNTVNVMATHMPHEKFIDVLRNLSFSGFYEIAPCWDDRFQQLMEYLNGLGVTEAAFYRASRMLYIPFYRILEGLNILQSLGNEGQTHSKLFKALYQLSFDVGDVEQASANLTKLLQSPTCLSSI